MNSRVGRSLQLTRSAIDALPGTSLVRGLAGRTERASRDLARQAVDTAVQVVIESRLIDHVIARLLAAGVVESVVAEVLANPETERLLARTLERPELERLIIVAVESPATDRIVRRLLESPGTERAVTNVLDSEELQRVVDRIANSPEVQAAIAHQSIGFANSVAEQARIKSISGDDRAERFVRRILRRPQRVDTTPMDGRDE